MAQLLRALDVAEYEMGPFISEVFQQRIADVGDHPIEIGPGRSARGTIAPGLDDGGKSFARHAYRIHHGVIDGDRFPS
jgi:hypothetical protein